MSDYLNLLLLAKAASGKSYLESCINDELHTIVANAVEKYNGTQSEYHGVYYELSIIKLAKDIDSVYWCDYLKEEMEHYPEIYNDILKQIK